MTIKQLYEKEDQICICLPKWAKTPLIVLLTAAGVEGGHATWVSFVKDGPARMSTLETQMAEYQDSALARRSRRQAQDSVMMQILCDISPRSCDEAPD